MSYPISEKQRQIVTLQRQIIRTLGFIKCEKERLEQSNSDERKFSCLFYITAYLKAIAEGQEKLRVLKAEQSEINKIKKLLQ